MATLREPLFGVNNFNEPKIITGNNVLAMTILLILFGKPGCYPSIPNLGMNIQQYIYSKYDEINVDAIKAKLTTQCSMLSNSINSDVIEVFKTINNGNPVLVIKIPIVSKNDTDTLVLGVTTNDTNNVVYNYEIMADTF